MRLTFLLGFALAVALTHAAPVSEDKAEVAVPVPTTVASLGEAVASLAESKEAVTEVPEEEATTTEAPGNS